MILTSENFLTGIKSLVAFGEDGNGHGKGFHRSIPIQLLTVRTSAGLVLTASTVPAIAALETNFIGLSWVAASASTAITIVTEIPLDYDSTYDKLEFAIISQSAGTTDAPIYTATGYKKRAGAALATISSITSSSAVALSTASASETIVVLSGKGLQAKDCVTINIAPATHTTDALSVYGIEARYRSTLVAQSPDNR